MHPGDRRRDMAGSKGRNRRLERRLTSAPHSNDSIPFGTNSSPPSRPGSSSYWSSKSMVSDNGLDIKLRIDGLTLLANELSDDAIQPRAAA